MKKQLLIIAMLATVAHADPKQGSEARTATSFHAIDLTGVLEVEARIGPARVEVTGDADRLAQVTTEVKGGTLVLGTKGKLKGVKKLKVIVSAPVLDAITVSGTGMFDATGLTGDKLAISVPGTGQLKLAGAVKTVSYAIPGTGSVEAKDLITSTTSIEVGGTGQMTVHAKTMLDVAISGTGAVNVHGSPASVKKSITGTGAIDVK